MAVADMIPTMSDKELDVLRENALRWSKDGAPKQRTAADELLPLIEAERAAREAAKPPPAPRARKTAVKKKAAKKAETEAED